MAEEDDRRLEITGSVCLDRFIVETDLLSASTNTDKKILHEMQNLIQLKSVIQKNALKKGLKKDRKWGRGHKRLY